MADETSNAAREAIAIVERRRRELGIDEGIARNASKPDYSSVIPHWVARFDALDPLSKRAWDERLRRVGAGTASPADLRIQEAARLSLETGTPFPDEAMKMPGAELGPDERTWFPDSVDNPQRAVSFGIPPLIAERIARGSYRETRSTKACARVGIDYLLLVLVGDVGCGKTYAAAHWLWYAKHEAPASIRRRVGPRRFLEAPLLVDVPFADRAEFGQSLALVVDDCGTEKDFLRNDLAQIFVQRYRNALPTVLTTNLSEADFREHYGKRFFDRMREVGQFVVVSNSEADSLRGK